MALEERQEGEIAHVAEVARQQALSLHRVTIERNFAMGVDDRKAAWARRVAALADEVEMRLRDASRTVRG